MFGAVIMIRDPQYLRLRGGRERRRNFELGSFLQLLPDQHRAGIQQSATS